MVSKNNQRNKTIVMKIYDENKILNGFRHAFQ